MTHPIGQSASHMSHSAAFLRWRLGSLRFIILIGRGEDRCALAKSIGVPTDIADYREHGQDAHATLRKDMGGTPMLP